MDKIDKNVFKIHSPTSSTDSVINLNRDGFSDVRKSKPLKRLKSKRPQVINMIEDLNEIIEK